MRLPTLKLFPEPPAVSTASETSSGLVDLAELKAHNQTLGREPYKVLVGTRSPKGLGNLALVEENQIGNSEVLALVVSNVKSNERPHYLISTKSANGEIVTRQTIKLEGNLQARITRNNPDRHPQLIVSCGNPGNGDRRLTCDLKTHGASSGQVLDAGLQVPVYGPADVRSVPLAVGGVRSLHLPDGAVVNRAA